jgi:cytochrome c
MMRRLGTLGVILLGVLLTVLAVSLARARLGNRTSASEARTAHAVAPSDAAANASTPLLSREEESGRLVYERYCIYCHGAGGDGFGINASNLRLEPPALADPRRLANEIDQHVADRIAGGGMARGLPAGCPPWSRRLGAGNVQAVVAYLRWLARTAPASSPLP